MSARLHGGAGGRGVAGDGGGQGIHALAVRGDETLRRHRLATPERFQKVEIAVWAPPVSDAIGLAFEHHLKTHLASSLSSVNVGVESVKSLDLSRRVRGEAGRFYPTLVGVGSSLLWAGRGAPGGGIADVGAGHRFGPHPHRQLTDHPPR